jgi:hypothetical protein
LHALRTGLPVELTTFIGRERELERTRDLVQHSWCVTFTGVGGSGKTRLAPAGSGGSYARRGQPVSQSEGLRNRLRNSRRCRDSDMQDDLVTTAADEAPPTPADADAAMRDGDWARARRICAAVVAASPSPSGEGAVAAGGRHLPEPDWVLPTMAARSS